MMILIVNFLLLNKTNPRSNNFRIRRLLRKLPRSKIQMTKIVLVSKNLPNRLKLKKEESRRLLLLRRKLWSNLQMKIRVLKMKNLKNLLRQNLLFKKLLFQRKKLNSLQMMKVLLNLQKKRAKENHLSKKL